MIVTVPTGVLGCPPAGWPFLSRPPFARLRQKVTFIAGRGAGWASKTAQAAANAWRNE